MIPNVPYLEPGGSNDFLLKTVGSKGSLLRNGGVAIVPFQNQVIPVFYHIETGGSNGSLP